MKKPKPPKIRKIWAIKPVTRVKRSGKREILARQRDKEAREHLREE